MKKKFVLFTIKRRIPFPIKLLKFTLNLLPFVIIVMAFAMKLHYIIVVVLLFAAIMLRKLCKVRVDEEIEIYYDYLIFNNPRKQVEIDFFHVHHIEIDVAEEMKGHMYIRELVLLDHEEKELLSIDGKQYKKEQLEYLVNHILSVQETVAYR